MAKHKLFRAVAFALCLCVMLTGLSALLPSHYHWEEGTGEHADRTEGHSAPDVLFLGSSHVYTGVSPAVLYASEGIASYLLASSGQPFDRTLDLLRDQLRHERPGLVVVDLFAALWEEGEEENIHHELIAIEGIQSPMLRARALLKEFGLLDGIRYFWDLNRTHDRYLELQRRHWEHHTYHNKGAMVVQDVNPQQVPEAADPSAAELRPEMLEIVQQMMALCAEKEVPLAFTLLPAAQMPQVQNGAAAMGQLIEQQGGIYLDWNTPEAHAQMGLDFSQDFKDDHHMNMQGQEKCSRWLAGQLKAQFDLPDRRGQADYESWEHSEAWWKNLKLERALAEAETFFQVTSRLLEYGLEDTAVLLVVAPDSIRPDNINGGVQENLLALGMDPELPFAGGILLLDDGEVAFQSVGAEEGLITRVDALPVVVPSAQEGEWLQFGSVGMHHTIDTQAAIYDKTQQKLLYNQLCYLG